MLRRRHYDDDNNDDTIENKKKEIGSVRDDVTLPKKIHVRIFRIVYERVYIFEWVDNRRKGNFFFLMSDEWVFDAKGRKGSS